MKHFPKKHPWEKKNLSNNIYYNVNILLTSLSTNNSKMTKWDFWHQLQKSLKSTIRKSCYKNNHVNVFNDFFVWQTVLVMECSTNALTQNAEVLPLKDQYYAGDLVTVQCENGYIWNPVSIQRDKKTFFLNMY